MRVVVVVVGWLVALLVVVAVVDSICLGTYTISSSRFRVSVDFCIDIVVFYGC